MAHTHALTHHTPHTHMHTQGDLEAALAAKDAAIEQMQRELEELQSKLGTAEQTILHLTTSKAAEMVRSNPLLIFREMCREMCVCS